MSGFAVFLLLFAFWSSLSTYLALDRDYSVPLWDRTMKTVVLVMAVLALTNTKARIQAVVWACVVSLGYYAVKGGEDASYEPFEFVDPVVRIESAVEEELRTDEGYDINEQIYGDMGL